MTKKRFFIELIIGIIILLAFIFLPKSPSRFGSDSNHQRFIQESQVYIQRNNHGIEKILAGGMDQAMICSNKIQECASQQGNTLSSCTEKCEKQNKDFIYENLLDTAVRHFPSTYFVRVKNPNSIQKLFLSGKYEEIVVKKNQKKVYEYLQEPKGEYLGGIFMNQAYSNMIYFQDLYSEAEVIFPIIQKGGLVLGGVVRLYAD